MNRPRQTPVFSPRRRLPGVIAGALAGLIGLVEVAAAAPTAGAWLVFDARTGEVMAKQNADHAWYPASVTKLMTAWVTLQAIRAGRIRPTTAVPMTAVASRQPPSKMGFKVGEVVTVDNALKIIMVKSANDVSWALAEAVGGSKEAFVAEMNRQARLLGMRSTHWGNPNGLPDATQVTTARDLGILARALLNEFPEASGLWRLPAIQIGNDVINNHNHLLDRFPGADGMKTGFICSSGFNVVATATRGNRKLVAVVLGSRSARARAELAAELFTKGFEGGPAGNLFGRFTAPETLDHMARGPEAGAPPRDMKPEICGKKRENTPDVDDVGETAQLPSSTREGSAVIRPGEAGWAPVKPASHLTQRFDIGPPVRVWIGGADAAPGDAGEMLALAPGASSTAAPVFSTAGLPSNAAPGAIRPRDPAFAGTGYGSTLPPADGAPMMIAAPGVAGASKPVAASRPAAVAAKPAAPAKTAAKPSVPAKAGAKPGTPVKPAAASAAKPGAKPAAKAGAKPAPVPVPSSKPKKAGG